MRQKCRVPMMVFNDLGLSIHRRRTPANNVHTGTIQEGPMKPLRNVLVLLVLALTPLLASCGNPSPPDPPGTAATWDTSKWDLATWQ